jgi:lipase
MTTDLTLHTYGRDPAEAPVVVLLHGFSDSGPSWADAIERFSDRYRVVAVDARGHGESPRFTDDQMADSAEVMCDDAVQVLTDLKALTGRPSLLLGHSMGASVAGQATARAPELVAATVLEDPPWWLPVDGPSPWERDAQAAADADSAEEEQNERGLTARPGSEEPSEPTVEERIAAQRAASPEWPESELRPWAVSKTQLDPAFAAGRRSRRRAQTWPDTVTALKTPTLLVTGTGSVLVRADTLAEAERLNPLLRTVVIEGANHCVRRDRGDAFHAAVDAFLAEHAPVVEG